MKANPQLGQITAPTISWLQFLRFQRLTAAYAPQPHFHAFLVLGSQISSLPALTLYLSCTILYDTNSLDAVVSPLRINQDLSSTVYLFPFQSLPLCGIAACCGRLCSDVGRAHMTGMTYPAPVSPSQASQISSNL